MTDEPRAVVRGDELEQLIVRIGIESAETHVLTGGSPIGLMCRMRFLWPLAVAGLALLGGCSSSRPADTARLTLNNPYWDRVNVQLVITRGFDCDSRGDGVIDSRELVMPRNRLEITDVPNGSASDIEQTMSFFSGVLLSSVRAFGYMAVRSMVTSMSMPESLTMCSSSRTA